MPIIRNIIIHILLHILYKKYIKLKKNNLQKVKRNNLQKLTVFGIAFANKRIKISSLHFLLKIIIL